MISTGICTVLINMGLGFGAFSSGFDIFGGYGFIAIICGAFLVYFLFSYKEFAE